MGTENNKPSGEQVNGQTGGSTTGSSTKNTTSGGRTGTRSAGSGSPGGKTEKDKPNGLVVVDIPGDKTDEKKPARRGRPPGSTSTTKKKTTAATQKSDTQHIKILLLTVSGIVASREGMSIWALTPQEIDSLADPLAAVMDKHNVGKATGEYAEYIALVMALLVVFVPKYLMWSEQNKQKKEQKKNEIQRSHSEQQQQRQPEQQSRTVTNSSQQSNRTTTDHGKTFSGQLHHLIPATF